MSLSLHLYLSHCLCLSVCLSAFVLLSYSSFSLHLPFSVLILFLLLSPSSILFFLCVLSNSCLPSPPSLLPSHLPPPILHILFLLPFIEFVVKSCGAFSRPSALRHWRPIQQ